MLFVRLNPGAGAIQLKPVNVTIFIKIDHDYQFYVQKDILFHGMSYYNTQALHGILRPLSTKQ